MQKVASIGLKLLTFLSFSIAAQANEMTEMQAVNLLADSHLALPLSQLVSQFSRHSMISVSAAFGAGVDQKKKIEDGEPADLFIATDPQLFQQLKLKGMIDVYSLDEIAAQGALHYNAAVVAGENMDSARTFLQYLKSDEAKEIFERNGLHAP